MSENKGWLMGTFLICASGKINFSSFDDEFYFSRLFKRACGSSPLTFREYETTLRGGAQSSTR